MCFASGEELRIAGRVGGTTERSSLGLAFDKASAYLIFGEEGSKIPSESRGSGGEIIASLDCWERILAVKAFGP